MRLWSVAAAMAALLAAGAAAAPGSAPVTDWTNVETVVITAKIPGPVLWHIVKGDSEVWILPTVSPVPENMDWNKDGIAGLLKGANAVLLPPKAEVGMVEGLWFYMTDMDELEQPDGTRLEATLPAAMRERFVAERARIGKDEDRYGKYLGGVAALMLESDYWKSAGLVNGGLQKDVERLASHAGVRARAIATYPAMGVLHDVPKMTAAAHLACLTFALDDIATERAHAAAAAEAWAVGDLDGIKAHYSEIRLDDCLQQNGTYAALRETAIRDEANAIVQALAKPGKTIAVMPMGFFLRKGGVIERLQAAGLTVQGPGG
jgi:TraB/PrgY/gumN family